MMKYNFIILIWLVVLCIGCAKENDNFRLNERFSIVCGQTLPNHQHDISITFDSMISESRCQEGVECFWEGNARGVFTLTHFEAKESFFLDTYKGPHFFNDTTISGYHIRLLALYPDPGLIVPEYLDSVRVYLDHYIAELEISP